MTREHSSNNYSMHLEVLIMNSVCGLVLLVIIAMMSYFIHANISILNENLQKLVKINSKLLKVIRTKNKDNNGGDDSEG